MMNGKAQHDYDVVIIGGHLVGSLLACALAETPLRMALVEPRPWQVRPVTTEYDLRVFALNLASQRIFRRLNLFDAILQQRAFPYHAMSVWEHKSKACVEFDCAQLHTTELGYIVEEQVLLNALKTRLDQLPQLNYLAGNTLKSLQRLDQGVLLQLEDGTCLQTQLVVGADGQFSTTRQQLGISCKRGSYEQTAIVATVQTEQSHQHTAWQRFLPSGPLAFLPLSDQVCSIVWSLDTPLAESHLALAEESFEQTLSDAFEYRLGSIRLLSPRRHFPLNYLHAEHYCVPHAVLLGDAAHTMHPLAGQGVNLGFMDAAVLAHWMRDAYHRGRSVGDLNVLRRYERQRKLDNTLMLTTVSGFKKLFAEQRWGLPFLRDIGMRGFNQFAWAKHQAMIHAAGLSGELPELAQPI